MGAKGSSLALPTRLQPSDALTNTEHACYGLRSPASALGCWDGPSSSGGSSPTTGRLLAVGCEDGSVSVYGAEGVQCRLSEDQIPPSSSADASKEDPRVLFVAFLSAHTLVTVHPRAVKLWSLLSRSEVFALRCAALPEGLLARGAEFTCAGLATEFQAQYVWVGTRQGSVLLFDAAKQRLSQFVVPLLPEAYPGGAAGARSDLQAARAAALAATAAGLLPPTAVTCVAQLPTDASQLLIGYASDVVLSYHIGTKQLHRAYRRAQSGGGVTSLCWELGPPAQQSTADSFAVGHRNGSIAVWKRKNAAAPAAVFFLSAAPGPRAPISSLRWSARSAGFFVAGGHLLPKQSQPQTASADQTATPAAAVTLPAAPEDQGAVVFVSGDKFQLRRVCATSLHPGQQLDGSAAPVYGVRDFVTVQMVARSAPAASPSSAAGAGAKQATPAFISLLASGALNVSCPTISPPVPALPLTDLHDPPADSVQLITAAAAVCGGDATASALASAERAALLDVLSTLRSRMHSSHRSHRSGVRGSLVAQGLWPLTGGVSSEHMRRIEMQEDALFANLRVVDSPKQPKAQETDTAAGATASEGDTDSTPLPALLLTTHSGSNAAIRFFDATNPFAPVLLAVLPLARLIPRSAAITRTLFCPVRKELLVATSVGEVLMFKLTEFKPAPPPQQPQPSAGENNAAATSATLTPSGIPASPAPAATVTPSPANEAAPASPRAAKIPSRPSSPAPAAAAPAAPRSPSPAPAPSLPAHASVSAAPATPAPTTPAAAVPASEPLFVFELAHRVQLGKHAVTLLRFVPEVSKYFVADEEGSFALLRPDSGVALVQSVAAQSGAAVSPDATPAMVTAVCSSSELLASLKGPALSSSPALLYVCASDGSVHVLDAAAEARLTVLHALLLSEPPVDASTGKPASAPVPEATIFMQAVTVGGTGDAPQAQQVSSPRAASSSPATPASSGKVLFVCASSTSIKLLGAGPKGQGPETLLSVKLEEAAIKRAWMITTPHILVGRVQQLDAPAGAVPPAASAELPAAREHCVAVLDDTAMLRVFALNLSELSCTPLPVASVGAFRSDAAKSISVSSDGRLAFLPCDKEVAALSLGSVFALEQYGVQAPPPALLHPSTAAALARDVQMALPSTAATDAAAAANAGGWFSSLRGAVSHESLFAPPMFAESQRQVATSVRSRPDTGAAGAYADAANAARAREAEGDAARAHWDAVKASKTSAAESGASNSTPAAAAASNARREIGSVQQQMGVNVQQAALNLRRAEEVADKSEEMASHAGDFLAAARALRKQQESSWF